MKEKNKIRMIVSTNLNIYKKRACRPQEERSGNRGRGLKNRIRQEKKRRKEGKKGTKGIKWRRERVRERERERGRESDLRNNILRTREKRATEHKEGMGWNTTTATKVRFAREGGKGQVAPMGLYGSCGEDKVNASIEVNATAKKK
jgi:hypothetical protein